MRDNNQNKSRTDSKNQADRITDSYRNCADSGRRCMCTLLLLPPAFLNKTELPRMLGFLIFERTE